MNILQNIDHFVIEKQMSFRGKSNPQAVRLSHHLESYLMLRYGGLSSITEFPAYNKTQVLGAQREAHRRKNGTIHYKSRGYSDRKKWAICLAYEIIVSRNEWDSLECICDMKKKDDVSDCLVQGLAFVILKFIIQK